MDDDEANLARQAQDALRQLKLDPIDCKAIETLREAYQLVTLALSRDVSSDVALKSLRSEVALGVPALIGRVKEGVSRDEGINYMIRVFEDLASKIHERGNNNAPHATNG
jgi:hypothetical protein